MFSCDTRKTTPEALPQESVRFRGSSPFISFFSVLLGGSFTRSFVSPADGKWIRCDPESASVRLVGGLEASRTAGRQRQATGRSRSSIESREEGMREEGWGGEW